MRTRLIVATINTIPCRTCVHPSTFHKVLIYKFCISKCREIIIFAHNYFRKTQTNQAPFFDFQSSIFFLLLGLDTLFQFQSILTLIVKTAVSAVLGTFSKQQQGALKVSFWSIFCYVPAT